MYNINDICINVRYNAMVNKNIVFTNIKYSEVRFALKEAGDGKAIPIDTFIKFMKS